MIEQGMMLWTGGGAGALAVLLALRVFTSRGGSGVLTELIRSRLQLRLAQEHNTATRAAYSALPPGAVLMQRTGDGDRLIICMPEKHCPDACRMGTNSTGAVQGGGAP